MTKMSTKCLQTWWCEIFTTDKGLYLWFFTYLLTKFSIIYCMQVILSDFHFFGNFPKKCFVIWRLANQKTWFTSLSELVLLPWLFSETLNPSLNRAMDSELDFYRSYFSTGNCIRIYIGSTTWCGTWCGIWCGIKYLTNEERILRNKNDEVKASSALQFSNGMGTTRVNLKTTTGP